MLASLEACREQHGVEAAHGLTMVGIELPGMSALVCRMNLVLAGAAQQSVVFAGNALKQPVCAWDGDTLRTINFDVVAANPPFGAGTVNARGFEPGEPLVIPRRLHNRPYSRPTETPADTEIAA